MPSHTYDRRWKTFLWTVAPFDLTSTTTDYIFEPNQRKCRVDTMLQRRSENDRSIIGQRKACQLDMLTISIN